MESLKVKTLIIRTEIPGGIFEGTKELTHMILNAFPNGGHNEFRPAYDKFIKDAVLTQEGDKITIKGKLCKFLLDLRSEKDRRYKNKFFIYPEFGVKGNKLTAADVVDFIKTFSKDRIIPKEEDVKIGFKNLLHKFLNKKTYYFDASPEIISALHFIEKESILKDEKGYYSKSWYQSTLMPPEDFEVTTNAYRLTVHK